MADAGKTRQQRDDETLAAMRAMGPWRVGFWSVFVIAYMIALVMAFGPIFVPHVIPESYQGDAVLACGALLAFYWLFGPRLP